ncbi:MAG: amino acid adenylation domain-containing protein, partial [Actinomycetota bacterium]
MADPLPAQPIAIAVEGSVTASQQQAALWFLDRIDPGKSIYNIPLVLRLKGSLSVDNLSTCTAALVERHELLRSRLMSRDGDVFMEPASPSFEALSVDCLDDVPTAARAAEALRRAHELVDRPFDLAVGPLFRAGLFRVTEGEHLLALSVHHAVADGRSIEILLAELSALYQRLEAGQPLTLPALPARYADFCTWQREQLAGEPRQTQLDYWKRQLAGLPPAMSVQSAAPRPPVFTGDGSRVRRRITRRTLAEVEQTARRHKVTPFMLLLTVFYTLLHRYGAGQDLVVGTPISGRSRRDLEALVGYFVNVLPLRCDLSGDPTFAALLERVRETCVGALGSPDIPFARVVEALQIPRDAAYPPLVQACISLQDQFDCFLKLPGLDVELAPHNPRTAKFDLLLALDRDGDELAATLEYYTGLFDPGAASRFLDHYCRLLERAVTFPGSPISELELLDDAEREQLLGVWNATAAPYPDAPVHRLFEEQARRTPDAAAVLDGKGAVSYAELNERANRLARWLEAEGAAPGDVVGVFLERSPELVAVLLAVLKLGAAYLPLDLSSPPERLGLMAGEAGVRTVVTRQALRSALGVASCRVLYIEDASASTIHEADGDLETLVNGAALAYVMFTSGSTGKPKAVEVPHRAIVRLLFGVDYCRFGPEETHLLLAPVSFDASTFELWGALLHGGRCALFPDALPATDTLGVALREWEVTNLWLTTSLFNFVIDEAPEILRGVRRLLTGGEALSVPHVRRALELLPETQLVNGYGPTEGTTFTCCFRIPRQLPDQIVSMPIGTPIGNTRVYVLDRAQHPAPIDVPGELYIAGDGLARGYRNDPELTSERFVSVVIGGVRERLYRSGDLARWRTDGNLEFLGRFDRQIKIRGHRIEPAEIEAALLQHPCLVSARVLAQSAPTGELRLIAYVVPNRDSQPDPEAIRAHLAQLLPPYLTPDRLFLLERLPLTANGKLDPVALSNAVENGEAEGEWETPAPGLERELAGIWSELLGVERIGRRDRFFDLGGHSLLAVRLVSRLERAYGVRLSLRQLLDRPTIESLAPLLVAERKSVAPPRGVIQPAAVVRRADGTAPLSFAQQRLWFLDQLEPGNPAFVLPAVFRLSGDLKLESLRNAIRKLTDRHEVLRTVIQERDGGPVQVVGPPPECVLSVLDLSQASPAERERRTQETLAIELKRGFDLARGPLLRTQLLRLFAEEHLLLITQHHIISDGWSLDIIRRELEELYHADIEQRAAALPPMALQYRDFAEWQRQLSTA